MDYFFQIEKELCATLDQRIMLLDGAMGTMIQQHKLEESDFRSDRFLDHKVDLKGNNDLLNLTQPQIIEEIHRSYFLSGSDIVSTNTFNSNSIAQSDYKLENISFELNKSAAEIANAARNSVKDKVSRKLYIAGALGPTNRTASLSPDVNRPEYRAVSFDELKDSYREQIDGLIAGGVDLLIGETVLIP